MKTKIIFMGTPDFAVASLEAVLKAKYDVAAVITVPDKPVGRGHKLKFSPVKECALQHDLPVLQPENLSDDDFLQQIKDLKADLFVVVAFRKLPKKLWSLATMGTFNLHASLLPQYRGAAPINWAVINGESKTGVSTFFIDEKIDTGALLLRDQIEINSHQNAGEVHDVLMDIGAKLVVKTIKGITNGTLKPYQQNIHDGKALKKAPKIFKSDCLINFKLDAAHIHNLIRGLAPYPCAFFKVLEDGKVLNIKVFKASYTKMDAVPYQSESDQKSYWKIGAKGGVINLLEIQYPGKKKLAIQDFLRGKKISDFSLFKD